MTDNTTGLSRRGALLSGAASAPALVLARAYDARATQAARAVAPARTGRGFDQGWTFKKGDFPSARKRSFDDSSWRRIELPHDWSIEDLPGGSNDGGATAHPAAVIGTLGLGGSSTPPSRIGPFDQEQSPGKRATGYTIGGVGWYRKRFRIHDLAPGQRATVRFDGVFQNSDVWLNGKHLGFHPNGYTGFEYDLTPHLREGDENVLAVRVDNSGLTSRWYSGSGIYRHTWLTVTAPLHVPLWGVSITTPVAEANRAQVRLKVDVANTSKRAAASVRVTIVDSDGRRVAQRTSSPRDIEPESDGRNTFVLRLPVRNPRRWSPSRPHLYRARVEVLEQGKVVDRVTETFGIRSIRYSDQGFFLNGRETKMRGVNLHHDHGPLGAVALAASETRRVRLLKEAGFNAIRTSHNPPGPELLDACDRLGMLVYTEGFDMWDDTKTADDYGKHFAEWWKRDATAWVLAERNHPSVVIRSIGNEIDLFNTSVRDELRGAEVAAFVKKLDPTRPICQGGAQYIQVFAELGHAYAAPYSEVLDVHYLHDYSVRPAQFPGRAWVQSESQPSWIYEDWQLVVENDFAIGDFVWTGWDYIGEVGLGAPLTVPVGTASLVDQTDKAAQFHFLQTTPYPWYGAGSGDFDLVGSRKPQLLYRRVVWGESNLELLVERPGNALTEQVAVGWGWFDELESWTWDVAVGERMTVRAYSTGDAVRLFLNGVQIAATSLTSADKRIATFQVPYTPGTLTAVSYRNGQQTGRKTLSTAGRPARLRLVAEERSVTTSRDDLLHVRVEVLDARGRKVPDAVEKVVLKIDGGALVGFGNGNPHNVDSFKRPRRHTYHGEAVAYIRPPRRRGTIRIRAVSGQLGAATLEVPVRRSP